MGVLILPLMILIMIFFKVLLNGIYKPKKLVFADIFECVEVDGAMVWGVIVKNTNVGDNFIVQWKCF